ncbi:PaaI family thioesterase [Kitasatospora sp. NPDC050543]|uniref:PaaI family thioesterase n=1 Tax=Kitasatospora sp. NPDC050543 TaxID=3364054 RepID=UPI00379C5500
MPTESSTAVAAVDVLMCPGQLNELITQQFPDYAACRVVDVDGHTLTMEVDGSGLRTRPGGTISGPEQAGLADLAAFLLINARLGPTLMALTSSMQISFLNRPRPGTLRVRARTAKFGRRLCVILAELLDRDDVLVASATLTYAIPSTPQRRHPA